MTKLYVGSLDCAAELTSIVMSDSENKPRPWHYYNAPGVLISLFLWQGRPKTKWWSTMVRECWQPWSMQTPSSNTHHRLSSLATISSLTACTSHWWALIRPLGHLECCHGRGRVVAVRTLCRSRPLFVSRWMVHRPFSSLTLSPPPPRD